MALLCLGGVGVVVALYDSATEIKRTAPDAVADSFLRAYLVNRDEKEVELYACSTGVDLAQLSAFRDDLVSREKQYSVSIEVSWEGLTVSVDGKSSVVDVDLTRSISDGSEQVTNRWRLRLADQDGWRVCGATKAE